MEVEGWRKEREREEEVRNEWIGRSKKGEKEGGKNE